ncbi:MAG: class I SAM-dependent methyltransferase [Actinomycetota bacterium]|nr:class I SAM-dependent methyltransferase [Actinomycetota bacterium]
MSGHKFSGDAARLDNPRRQEIFPIKPIIDVLGEKVDGIVVADLGAGTGYLSIPLAKHIGERGTVYAIDINPEMIAILNERSTGLSNLKVIKSEENSFPIPDGLVDASYMIAVFHELDDPTKFLLEIRRVSKPIHRIIVIDWNQVKGEMGPPLEERIPEEEVIKFFKNWGYGLEKRFSPSPYVYGLVFKVSTCKPLDKCWL